MQDETLLQACMRTIIQQTFYQSYWKTFSVVEADTDALRDQAFRLRYRVYRTDGRFEAQDGLDNPALIEKDVYDARAVHHLMIHTATGQVAGTVRVLLPGVSDPLKSFEMQQVVRHPLLENEDRAQHLCEISRLCMAWQFRRRPGDGRYLPAYCEQEGSSDMIPIGRAFARRRITYAPLGLIKAAFETAMDRGLLDCISLMDPADFRSFKRLGLPYKVLGPRVNTQDGSQQPVIYNIKNALDSMETVNPECWEIASDKGRLSQRASSLQLDNWHRDIFTETPQSGLLGRFL